jgi:hypothetical protein
LGEGTLTHSALQFTLSELHALMQRTISAWAELAAAEEASVMVGACCSVADWALANSARLAVRKIEVTRMLVVVSYYR